MVVIFYKKKNIVQRSSDLKLLDQLGYDDILWIDLIDPSGKEKHLVEEFMETELQSRAKAEEIESSSRFFETESGIFANTNFLISQPESFIYETVSFILSQGILVTLHSSDLRTLNEIGRKLQINAKLYPTAYHLMIAILESRIDLDADMVEGIAKEIAHLSARITNLENKVDEEMLIDINQLQENTMLVRENITDKQRLISNIMRSNKFPSDIYPKLNILIKDIGSLINHTDFSFERMEYLQNTIMGLINIEQNKIIKIFSVVAVFFMPPTLIASMYGMNLTLPLVSDEWDLPISIILMITSVVITFIFFKKRKML